MRRGRQRMRWLESITDLRAQSLQSCPTLWPHGPWPARLLCPWDSPSKNIGVGCHFLLYHWLNGREFEQTLGDSGGQRSLVCCSPLGHKDSDMPEQLKNNKFNPIMCTCFKFLQDLSLEPLGRWLRSLVSQLHSLPSLSSPLTLGQKVWKPHFPVSLANQSPVGLYSREAPAANWR